MINQNNTLVDEAWWHIQPKKQSNKKSGGGKGLNKIWQRVGNQYGWGMSSGNLCNVTKTTFQMHAGEDYVKGNHFQYHISILSLKNLLMKKMTKK